MKTPREILLTRHTAANARLDAIRAESVRAASTRQSSSHGKLVFAGTVFQILTTAFRELIVPARRTWMGLAAAWVVLAVLNFSQSTRHEGIVSKSTLPSAELRLAFQEHQRLLDEILGVRAAAGRSEAPRLSPPGRPRSQRTPRWTTA